MLLFSDVDPRNMTLSRRIKNGGYTVRNDRASWWVLKGNHHTSMHCDILHCCWIGHGDLMVEIKDVSPDKGKNQECT